MTPVEAAVYMGVKNVLFVYEAMQSYTTCQRGNASLGEALVPCYPTTSQGLPQYLMPFESSYFMQTSFSVGGGGVAYPAGYTDAVVEALDHIASSVGVLFDDFIDDVPHLHQLQNISRVVGGIGKDVFLCLYTSELAELGPTGLSPFLKAANRPMLWMWDRAAINNLTAHWEAFEAAMEYAGGEFKPMLGLYMFDYSGGATVTRRGLPMPEDLMNKQLEVALSLLRSGRAHDVILLGSPIVDLPLQAVQQSRAWAAQHHNEPINVTAGRSGIQPLKSDDGVILPAAALALLSLMQPASAKLAALKAPFMGWNSFLYGNGSTIYGVPNETEVLGKGGLLEGFKENLMPSGYQYFVIDGGWGLPDVVDRWGRPLPAPAIYPSQSFKKVGDAVNQAGGKFGIWWMHGVPRGAVARKLPVKGTSYTADQVVEGAQHRDLCTPVAAWGCDQRDIPGASHQGNVSSAAACCAICKQTPNCTAWSWNSGYKNTGCYPKYDCAGGRKNSGCTSGFADGVMKPACSWTSPPLNYKLNTSHPGAKAYYASLVELWQEWGVSLVKIDCIFGVNMQLQDITLFSRVLSESSSTFVLSLSPQGGDHADIQAVKELATCARITGDFHRNWHQTFGHFAAAATLANETGNGFFLDLDLLPFGFEAGYPPNEPPWTPGRGMPFWQPVRRTIMSLWTMASSPLQYSGDMRTGSVDPRFPSRHYWSKELAGLLTNSAVLAAHQDLRKGKQLSVAADNSTIVWLGQSAADPSTRYVGIFNIWCGNPRVADPPCPVLPGSNGTNITQTSLSLPSLGCDKSALYRVSNLWNASASSPAAIVKGDAIMVVNTPHLDVTLLKFEKQQILKSDDDVTIDNSKDRTLGPGGAIVNGHDGSVRFFNGSFYYHALSYDDCIEQPEGCSSHCGSCCGYTLNHSVAVFVNRRGLAQDGWELAARDVLPLPKGNASSGGRGVIFRPKALRNPRTGRWHLFWANNLATASAPGPLGPFTSHGQVNVSTGQAGDFDIMESGGLAYIAYTSHGVIHVEQLTADWLHSTGNAVSNFHSNTENEAPQIFERQLLNGSSVFYLLYGRFCCFCTEGSGVFVHSAAHPLGPWAYRGEVGCRSGDEPHHSPLTQGCWAREHEQSILHAQLSGVIKTPGGQYVLAADRWQQAKDHRKSHDPQAWTPLSFNADGSIAKLTLPARFKLRGMMTDSLKTDDDGGTCATVAWPAQLYNACARTVTDHRCRRVDNELAAGGA